MLGLLLVSPSNADNGSVKAMATELKIKSQDKLCTPLSGKFKPRIVKSKAEFDAAIHEIDKMSVFGLPKEAIPKASKEIAARVNFKTHYLAIFCWTGSGRDKLTYSQTKNNTIQFKMIRGSQRDALAQFRIFHIPVGTKCSFPTIKSVGR